MTAFLCHGILRIDSTEHLLEVIFLKDTLELYDR